jgi:serine/threonine protein kinase
MPADMRTFVGTMLQDKYYLDSYLGGGNFGAVYKSRQHFLGVPIRRVAVKLSKHTDIDLTKAREIFADVFMLAEAMDEIVDAEAKKYLTEIYDAGVLKEDGRMFVVMEFVQGTDLTEQFESLNIVPSNQLLKWVRQICTALAGLHSMTPPCIHRDLKPDNILLGADNNVRIVDFGLAARLINYGYVPGVAGTLVYMAPETTKGHSTPASDIYSLGVIMYEGLTGHLPFEDIVPPIDLPEALYSDWLYNEKMKVIPVPPSSYNNTVSRKLDALVMRCLEFSPSRRYHDANALVKGLDELEKIDEGDGNDRLAEARSAASSGSLNGACRAYEICLNAADLSAGKRFAILREYGQALGKIGDHKGEAEKLIAALDIARNSGAVLRDSMDMAGLLDEIARAFTNYGNDWQASKYMKIKAELLKRGK